MSMPSSLHHHTPALAAFDPRGLNVRSVAYHRLSSEDQIQARVSCQVYGSSGFLLEQWDPRLHRLRQREPHTRANQGSHFSLGGHLLLTRSVDAGRRWFLRGAAGHVLTRWDSRGGRQRYEFDQALRLTSTFEHGAHEARERCVEALSYAGNTAQDLAANRCGRLIRHDDACGTLHYDHYAFMGSLLSEQRTFRRALDPADWPLSVFERDEALHAQRFTTTWQYNALGDVVAQIDAKGHCQHTVYGIDGLVRESALTLKDGVRQVLLDQRVCNASGRVQSERAGNNVMTVAHYCAFDERLERLVAYRAGQSHAPLQALAYEYDHVGNITHIRDDAQPVRWSSNTQVSPDSTYVYDSLYQLIRATGRENAHNGAGPALAQYVGFGATDDSVWRRYTQNYRYDEAGNLTHLQHQVSSGQGYSRTLEVAAGSNHGLLNIDPAHTPVNPGLGSGFDLNGNQHALLAGQTMHWTVANQLARVTLVRRDHGRDDEEVYGYDAAGQRARKVRTTLAGQRSHTQQVLYLPGLQVRHDTATGEQLNVITAQAGRCSVRVLQWDQHREQAIPDHQQRFSLTDQVGSSTLELNGQAQLLSQESYYPFGATAWWAAKNKAEAAYKTIRYAGKERDASGLYYYGFRYYAPWLQRWVSPDPAGDIEGLNVYAMVSNNPVSQTDNFGLNGAFADTRPERVQALDRFLRDSFPGTYLQTLDAFDHRYTAYTGPHAQVLDAVLAQGYSYEDIKMYNTSLNIRATRPANIMEGLSDIYIASSSYFNETARWLTNPAINPEPEMQLGSHEIVSKYEKMRPDDWSAYDPERSGMSDALSLPPAAAVSLFNRLIKSNPEGQATTYRGHRVSDMGLKALTAQAREGKTLRTEQFLSVSDKISVARSFALGTYDSRPGPLHPVMLTVKGTSAMVVNAPVDEAERVFALKTTFTIRPAGLSEMLVRTLVPSATHFVLQEVSVPKAQRKNLAFMTDPRGHFRS